MSRRKKRRTQQKESSQNKTKKFPWLLAFSGVAALGVGVTYMGLSSFLHGEELRQRVADKVGAQVGAPVVLEEFNWNGLHLESGGFSAVSEGAIQKLTGSGLELDVSTDLIERKVWNISNIELDSVELDLDLTKPFTTLEIEEPPSSWLSELLPKSTHLHDLVVHRVGAKVRHGCGAFLLKDLQLSAELDQSGAYLATCEGGQISLPFSLCKTAQIKQLKLRNKAEKVELNYAEVEVLSGARVQLEGEGDLETSQYVLRGDLNGLNCSSLLDEDWKQRLTGEIESVFEAKPSPAGEALVTGKLCVNEAELTALPVLDTIAQYTGVSKFKKLSFDTATSNYVYEGDVLKLTNIHLASADFLCIKGNLDVEWPNVDGHLHVGVKPYALQRIPGAVGNVFKPANDSLVWATVPVEGSLDNAGELIKQRLKDAALGHIFSFAGLQDVMEQSGGLAENVTNGESVESTKELAEQSLDVLKEDVIEKSTEAATGILEAGLDGLFGSPKRK